MADVETNLNYTATLPNDVLCKPSKEIPRAARGCGEGIVSKRRASPYRSGRVDHWLKINNLIAPAVKREAEEDWGR